MADQAKDLLRRWVEERSDAHRHWVRESLAELEAGAPERALHIFLGLAPRKLGKADLDLGPGDLAAADAAHPGWNPSDWSVDGAARVLALLTFAGERAFAETFKDLRRTADAGEMIALYRGIPLYPEPDALAFEVGEGLRSNLRPVFEAIAHKNPYPRDRFDDHRWNHMVLKALFVGSALEPIVGLRDRANEELARILVDYAEERWAAGRPVTPELWIPVRPFRADPAVSTRLAAATEAGRLREEELA